MRDQTRRQLRALSRAFYDARAADFDASRADLPWPGWERVRAALPAGPLRVLDVGCGNGRLARFLVTPDDGREPAPLDYLGLDASAALVEAAERRQPPATRATCRFAVHDFLESEPPGDGLPAGPFELVALMGVLHHVPGRATRRGLLEACADRLAPDGLLALTVWQFADRPRFARRRLPWSSLGPVEGAPVDEADLEDGDQLLGFGEDPAAAPRYCHQVADAEIEDWPARLGLEPVADFRADGAEGDLNRYLLLRRPVRPA